MKVMVIQEKLNLPSPTRSTEDMESFATKIRQVLNSQSIGMMLESEDATWFESVPEVWRDRANELIGSPGFPQHKGDPEDPSYISYPSYNNYDGQTRGALVSVAAVCEAVPTMKELIREGLIVFKIETRGLVSITWPPEMAHRLNSQVQPV